MQHDTLHSGPWRWQFLDPKDPILQPVSSSIRTEHGGGRAKPMTNGRTDRPRMQYL